MGQERSKGRGLGNAAEQIDPAVKQEACNGLIGAAERKCQRPRFVDKFGKRLIGSFNNGGCAKGAGAFEQVDCLDGRDVSIYSMKRGERLDGAGLILRLNRLARVAHQLLYVVRSHGHPCLVCKPILVHLTN